VLRQGVTEKRYAAELEEGVNELVIDVANPVATSPTLMLIPRETAIHRGVLAGRCEGIAGLSELRVEAGLALSGGAATLRYDAASFAFCGDGLTGSPVDDPLHIAYGYVDGLTAFRVPWRNDIETTLAEYGARQNMIVTGQNYNVSSDFAPDITDWREVPGTRYISNFNPDGTRIAAVSPTQAFPLKMTLLGRGIQVYPGISQDAIYAGEEPFRAEFELLWGPAVAASAIPNRATFEVSRPGFWSRNANAAPWKLLSGLPLKPPNSSADATVNAVASVAGIALREQTAVPTFGSGELGLYRRQGELWGAGAVWTDHRRPVAYGYASATRVLAEDLLLTLQDAPVQALNPGTSDCDVYLPSLTNEWGRFFRILNFGTSGSLALMDGNRELASIGPGQVCEVWPTAASGGPGWPLVAAVVNLPA
jgi:hypothetical protein